MKEVIGKGQIHRCRYRITLADGKATIRITGHGLRGMEAPYTMQHSMAKDGNIDRRDAAAIADLMLTLIKRIENLARMITAWGINAETGVSRLSPTTQRHVRQPLRVAVGNNKNKNSLEKLMEKV